MEKRSFFENFWRGPAESMAAFRRRISVRVKAANEVAVLDDRTGHSAPSKPNQDEELPKIKYGWH